MSLSKRKDDHLTFAKSAQSTLALLDERFDYEPLFGIHSNDLSKLSTTFLNFKLGAPLWISSMTGGSVRGKLINSRLAVLAKEFSLPLALGSCRPILNRRSSLKDFDVRKIIGDKIPLFANLGIAQVDELLRKKEHKKIEELIDLLRADGLVVHINPLQEFHQKEGDRFLRPPIETLSELKSYYKGHLIVKEVGQGMGPKSLAALFKLKVSAIEFSAFGGTNFSQLEALRNKQKKDNRFTPLATVGHTALQMLLAAESYKRNGHKTELIISGGVDSALTAHFYLEKLQRKGLVGMAYALLKEAVKSEKELITFVKNELETLLVARAFLRVKEK